MALKMNKFDEINQIIQATRTEFFERENKLQNDVDWIRSVSKKSSDKFDEIEQRVKIDTGTI